MCVSSAGTRFFTDNFVVVQRAADLGFSERPDLDEQFAAGLPKFVGYFRFTDFICSGGVTRITPCSSRYKLNVMSLTWLESSLIRAVKVLFAPFPSTFSGRYPSTSGLRYAV